jgi:anti-sigma factor RsiW
MKHYSKEKLDRYRHQEMSALARISCAAHLKECDECAKLLLELEQDDTFVSELRDSIRSFKEAGQDTSK